MTPIGGPGDRTMIGAVAKADEGLRPWQTDPIVCRILRNAGYLSDVDSERMGRSGPR